MRRPHFKRGRAAERPYVLFFAFLLPLSSFLFAYAVTYRVDPEGGPETLASEVKEAFDAWVALSSKIEVDETQENPEGIFQYGAAERFGPDTLSLTVQRQADTRSILYFISPNADNRKRILLHETGIAIGLTPQIPGTPAPPATTPTDSGGASPEASETTPEFETTPAPGTPTDSESETTPGDTASEAEGSSPTSSPESTSSDTESASESAAPENTTEDATEETTPEETTPEETTPEETTPEETTAEPTDTQPSEETATESPAPTLTENSVMNPSIAPDDSVELGDVERQLVEQLQLFVSEDINRDGAVNFYDLVALAQAFGRSGVNDPADITKDGVIDQNDVDALRQSYTFSDPSQTAPDAASTTPTDDDAPLDETTSDSPVDDVPTNTAPPPNVPPQDSTPSDDSGE